jgi:hypothetical protein
VPRDEHFKGKSFVTQDGNREWTAVIDCVSMDDRTRRHGSFLRVYNAGRHG